MRIAELDCLKVFQDMSYSKIVQLIFVAALFLQGCGSDDSSAPPLSPAVVYSGITDQASISQDNAREIFSMLVGEGAPGSSGFPVAAVVTEQGFPYDAPVLVTSNQILSLMRKAYFAEKYNSALLATGVIVDETVDGRVSGTSLVKGEIADDGTGSLIVTYNNFNDGDGEILDGDITINSYAYDPVYEEITDGSINVRYIKIQSDSTVLAMSGTIGTTTDIASKTSVMTMNVDVQDGSPARDYRFEDFVIVTVVENLFADVKMITSQSIAGRAYLDTEGYVDVTTESPMTCPSCPEFVPAAGGSVIIYGKNSKARAVFMSSQKVRIEVNSNGDDFYETSDIYLWSDLAGAPVQNEAPVVTNIQVLPESPYTNDDLRVYRVTVFDPEYDELTYNYAWYKNGVLISGQNSDTLPSTNFAKGDEIVARVLVSDGKLISSKESSLITILDSPPEVSAAPPASIAYGDTLSFQITAQDPDGDIVDGDLLYSILYGPAAMRVDPSGQVTWPASGPMFDTEMSVNWAVGISSPSETIELAGTTILNDPTRQLPIVRSGIVVPAMTEGMAVADFDDDGKNELLVTDSRMLYTLEYDGSDYVQDWAYAFDLIPGGLITAIDAHDLDGDGRPEIIVGGTNKLVVLDGVNRKVVSETSINFALASSIEVADVDNDGGLEVVFLGRESTYSGDAVIYVVDALTLKSEWQSAPVDYGRSLAIGELDGDAYPEIVASKGYVYGYDGAVYRNEWVYGSGFGFLVDTGDTNNDGVEEIIAAVDWTVLQAYDLRTKSIFWSTPADDLHSIKVANIDGDSADEVLVGDGQWGDVTAYSYRAISKKVTADWSISSQDHSASSITIGDIDNDNKVEIIWGTGTTSSGEDSLVVAGLNPTIEIEWRNLNPSELDGPFYGAEWASVATEDSRALFITPETDSGYSGARIVSMDKNGQLDWSSELGSNWSRAGSLSIADYDLDGVDEVFLATSETYEGYFTVYDFVADSSEWTSPSGLGTGVATSSGDLNGDGSDDFALITQEGYVYAYDTVNSVVIWQSGYLGGRGFDIEILNMDDDPALEIIVATTDKITILQKVLGAYGVKYEANLPGVNDIAAGDLNGDSRPEVVAINSTYPRGGVTLFNNQLGNLATFSLPSTANAVFIQEASHSMRKNIILSLDSDSTDYWNKEGYLAWFDPFQGQEIARSPTLIGRPQKNSLNFIDLNSDGEYNLVFGTDFAMYMSR